MSNNQTQFTKILVLGLTGMVGHQVWVEFANYESYQLIGTCRNLKNISSANWQKKLNSLGTIYEDIDSLEKILQIIHKEKPDIVINCLACLLNDTTTKNMNTKLKAIQVNSLWPLAIAQQTESQNIYFIHLSTDSVFGRYQCLPGGKSNDKVKPDDFYGYTKVMGEVSGKNTVTIRCCPVGLEIRSHSIGLISFLINHTENNLRGFSNCYFNGLTNKELARCLHYFFIKNRVTGIQHLVGPRISKYDLLELVNEKMKLGKEIKPDPKMKIDRSMIGDYQTNKSWSMMIDELLIRE